MNEVEYLVISSILDYSTDLVCYELEKRNLKYIRINRDTFEKYKICYSVAGEEMMISVNNRDYLVSRDVLKGIYFRAPVFLRSNKNYSLEQQLCRTQWNAFIRNLIVFDNSIWINHPVNTYRAENKAYQLYLANKIGFNIPTTHVGNKLPGGINKEKKYVIKSLDTALFYSNNQELFTYSAVVEGKLLNDEEIEIAPVIFQNYLENKIDLRVTVIGKEIIPIQILKNGKGIEGDWRKNKKEELQYKKTVLPIEINEKIMTLMDSLNLIFGGIDLILSNDKYYFIEINPTGEWGWINNIGHKSIETLIVNCLQGGQNEGHNK